MDTINTHFRLSYQVQDEAFNLSQAVNSNLYISISSKAIRFAVADLERNKIVALEDYELITVFTPLQVAEQLSLIAEQNPLLQEQRWLNVRVSISNQHFTLVPETLFDPAHQADYLRLHSDLNPQQEVVLYYRHSGLEAVNIFAVDGVIYRMTQSLFPERAVQFLHQTSPMIKSVLHQTDRQAGRSMSIFVERNYVTILVSDEGGLQFCNVFYYLSPEDFIYYIVFVMQEQKMNPEQETITAWGDITHDSSLFSILKRYIRNVRLGKRPADLGYSYKLDEMFEHRYFELYSMHFCE